MKKILLITLLAIGFSTFSQVNEEIKTMVVKKYNNETEKYDFIDSKSVVGSILIEGNRVIMHVDDTPTTFEVIFIESKDGYKSYVTESNLFFFVYSNKVILVDTDSGGAIYLYFK